MFSGLDEVEVVKAGAPGHLAEALRSSNTEETAWAAVSVSARSAFALQYLSYISFSPANPPIPTYPQAYPNSFVLPRLALM